MTEEEMVDVIRKLAAKYGTVSKAARSFGVSVSYLHDVLSERRSPGAAILRPLGYRRTVTTYEKAKK